VGGGAAGFTELLVVGAEAPVLTPALMAALGAIASIELGSGVAIAIALGLSAAFVAFVAFAAFVAFVAIAPRGRIGKLTDGAAAAAGALPELANAAHAPPVPPTAIASQVATRAAIS
jgi:hypothetical protein